MWLSIVSCVVSWVAQPSPAAPLEHGAAQASEHAPALPVDGAAPLDNIPKSEEPVPTGLSEGVEPLAGYPLPAPQDRHSSPPDTPLAGPKPPTPPPPLDPRREQLVRLDFLAGPMFRLRTVDAMVMSSIELGRARGFSAAFHTAFLVAGDREVVRALDVPIGVGAIARTRLRKRPLFASIGVTAGLLVHRAAIDDRVIRRVDPDFRVPIRLAWTIATIGISLALEQGYSVRSRSYEQRGGEVWSRSAYRIGFLLGLHSDIGLSRATLGRAGQRSRSRR